MHAQAPVLIKRKSMADSFDYHRTLTDSGHSNENLSDCGGGGGGGGVIFLSMVGHWLMALNIERTLIVTGDGTRL